MQSPSDSSTAGFGRRSFLRFLAASPIGLAAQQASSSAYSVGSGYSTDAYTAASTALAACGQFPTNLAGQTVIIKPNLVCANVASTGKTTDPQVVRAIVDLAIQAGATQFQIIEAAAPNKPSHFEPCGYTKVFTSTAYPQVQLLDMRQYPYTEVPVPGGGLACQSIWVSSLVMQPNTYFVSAAKMKTHVNAVVTLSMKCLVGLGSEAAYAVPGPHRTLARHDLHYRGIDLAIVDLNTVRPVDFAVIDGVWAMDGQGPLKGTRVATNVVLAGLNHVAVDRVALDVMEIAQDAVPHLVYGSLAGMGPSDTSNVTVLGDPYKPYKFKHAKVAPLVWFPKAAPNTISISAGQTTTVSYQVKHPCYVRAEIIQDDDANPAVVLFRTLHDFASVRPPGESLVWNGLNDSGQAVAPGTYRVRFISSSSSKGGDPLGYETAVITVTA